MTNNTVAPYPPLSKRYEVMKQKNACSWKCGANNRISNRSQSQVIMFPNPDFNCPKKSKFNWSVCTWVIFSLFFNRFFLSAPVLFLTLSIFTCKYEMPLHELTLPCHKCRLHDNNLSPKLLIVSFVLDEVLIWWGSTWSDYEIIECRYRTLVRSRAGACVSVCVHFANCNMGKKCQVQPNRI